MTELELLEKIYFILLAQLVFNVTWRLRVSIRNFSKGRYLK